MNKAKELFQQAVGRLDFVNEELNRPEEDVMTFSVCHQTRGIIADLLSAYLLANGKDISAAHDLMTLQMMCAQVDDRFAQPNISAMYCHPGKLNSEEEYCMDLGRVGSCVHIANNLRDMVEAKLAVSAGRAPQ